MKSRTKAIWITGASSGIGKALAIEFIKNGKVVLGCARRIELLNEIKNELGELGKNFQVFKVDVTKYDEIDKFYNDLSKEYEIDCLINNAGVTSFKPAEENSLSEIQNVIEVNLLGSIYTIKKVLPDMKAKKSGTIISILSSVTQKVFTNSSLYSASKAGLLAYTKVLREELRNDNIRVINVSPGAINTAIWPESVTQKYSSRMMNPKNIASMVFRLYAEESNVVPEEVVLRPITGDL
jgi:NADP-dependent 3-hydroxy acid dehydrogenase YdfG